MHFRPPIDAGALHGLRKPVHRRERRQAETRHVGAQMQRLIDIHQNALAARQQKTAGADDRRALHERVQCDCVAAFRPNVKVGEIGKLFRLPRHRRIERDAARR